MSTIIAVHYQLHRQKPPRYLPVPAAFIYGFCSVVIYGLCVWMGTPFTALELDQGVLREEIFRVRAEFHGRQVEAQREGLPIPTMTSMVDELLERDMANLPPSVVDGLLTRDEKDMRRFLVRYLDFLTRMRSA